MPSLVYKQKIEIVVAEVYRQYEIHQSQYCYWRDTSFEKGREGLKGRSTDRKVAKLRKELDRYKKMVAEMRLKNEILEETVQTKRE